jgi:hypothetical protein
MSATVLIGDEVLLTLGFPFPIDPGELVLVADLGQLVR